MVDEQKTIPAPLDYHGFPKSICTSVNRVVCHGIPNDKLLKKGDIINIDITVIKEGYHGDTSKMFLIGNKVSPVAKRLCQITQEAMWKGIEQVKEGATLGDVGFAIEQFVKKNHYSVVEEYCGHGIGQGFHEPPQVTHYGKKGTGVKIKAGMIFTIEPMVNVGKKKIKPPLADGWTVETDDRSLSAQWEHTILATKTGYEVLTLRKEEQ